MVLKRSEKWTEVRFSNQFRLLNFVNRIIGSKVMHYWGIFSLNGPKMRLVFILGLIWFLSSIFLWKKSQGYLYGCLKTVNFLITNFENPRSIPWYWNEKLRQWLMEAEWSSIIIHPCFTFYLMDFFCSSHSPLTH